MDSTILETNIVIFGLKSFTITYIKIRVKVLKLEIQVKMKYLKHFF